jgi:hypothetical protein
MHRHHPVFVALFTAALVAPATAGAIEYFEEGLTFTDLGGYGSQQLIVRDPGWFDGVDFPSGPVTIAGPSIEVECEPTVPVGYAGPYLPSVHHVLAPDDARALAKLYWAAADAAEAP